MAYFFQYNSYTVYIHILYLDIDITEIYIKYVTEIFFLVQKYV